MKKVSLIVFLLTNFSKSLLAQCTVDVYDNLCCGCYSQEVGDVTPVSGWTYSWSPTTYLNNSHIYNPIAMLPINTMITYTLTVTAPGCGTFVAGTSTVLRSGAAGVTPIGPITYYYQYEGTEHIVLKSSTHNVIGVSPTVPEYALPVWVKNTDWIMRDSVFTIDLTGAVNGTDYYSATYGCQDSNEVAVTYHGCVNDNEYPVGITHIYYAYGNCGPTLPATITQPNMGTGATYSWELQGDRASYYSITNQSGNTATLNITSTPPAGGSCGIYTRGVATNGTETRMSWGIGYFTSAGCGSRTAIHNEENLPDATITKTSLFPNPAKSETTVTSATPIKQIQLYNSTGLLVKNIKGNNSSSIKFSTIALKPGFYNCRVITEKGIESLKLIIQ